MQRPLLTNKCLFRLGRNRQVLVRNTALDGNGLKASPLEEELGGSEASDLYVCFEGVS